MVVRRIAELLVNVEARKAEQEVDGLERSVDTLAKKAADGFQITPVVNDGELDKFVTNLEKQRAEIKVQAGIDRQETTKLVRTIESQLKDIEANVDLDPAEAEAEAQRLRNSIKDVKIEAELNASDARNEIRSINSELKAIENQRINVDADTSKAKTAIEGIKPDPVKVDVEVDESSISGGISDAIGSSTALAATGFAALGAAGAAALITGFNGALELEASSDRLAANLGLTPDESQKLGEAASEVYAGAWGDSIDEVNQALRGIAQQGLQDVETSSQAAFEASAQSALDLANVLETDVNEVTRAAGQLFKNGLAADAEEAFDLIAAATQNGGNATGELLEVVTEYSVNWREAGFSGEQAMSQIVQAVDSGAFQIDKLGDLIKESGIKLTELDETKLTEISDATGLAASEIEKLSEAAKEGDSVSFLKLIESVKDIEDSTERSRAAVELFGTPFEDLSNSAFLDIDFGAELDDIAGSAANLGDTVNDNLSTRLEELKRGGFIALSDAANDVLVPAIDALIPAFEQIGPTVQQFITEAAPAFTQLSETIQTTFGPNLTESVIPALQQFGTTFIEDIVPAAAEFARVLIDDVLPPVLDMIESFQQFSIDVIENIVIPAVETLVTIFKEEVQPTFERDVVPAIEEVAAVLEALEPAFEVVTNVIGAVVIPALEVLLRTFVNVFGSVVSIVSGTVGTIRSLLTGDLAGVVSGVGRIFSGLVGLVRAPLDAVLSTIRSRVGPIGSIFESAFGRIESAVSTALSPLRRLIDLINSIPNSLPNPFRNFSVPDISLPNVPGFAYGGITTAPTFITSEFGHEEAIFPTAASVDYIKNILSQSSNDVLGRLYADYDANRTTTTTTSYGGTTNVTVNVEDSHRRSVGERRLAANQIASAIERRLEPAI